MFITVQPSKKTPERRPLKINFTETKTTNISQTITILYKTVHVLFGMDFGFFQYKSRQIKFLTKCTTVATTSLVCFASLLFTYFSSEISTTGLYAYYVLQYLIFVLIFLVSENHLCGFLHAMEEVDIKLKRKVNSADRIILVAVFIVVLRTAMTVFWCLTITKRKCIKPLWVSSIFFCILCCHDFILVTNSLVYFLVRARLVSLSGQLEKNDLFHSYHEYNVIYKSIADAVEGMKRSFDPLFFVALLFNVPENMMYIYYLVFMLSNNHISVVSLDIYFASLSVIGTLVLTILPALFAGMLTSQTDNIKVILNNKLILEDVTKSIQIQQFMGYIDTRPLKFNVYKVIPLNAQLIGMVLSFCATYLIVIIQLTHLY